MKGKGAAWIAAIGLMLASLLLTSCAYDPNRYDDDPEGTIYASRPVGYTSVVLGGYTYWHHRGHYCRYWPGYGYVVVRPPHGRRPYLSPPPYRPGGQRAVKPGVPVILPRKPGGKPPGTWKPGEPVVQPVNRSAPTARKESGPPPPRYSWSSGI